MASQEYREILKQGVEVWNQWRKEHRDVRPDLSGEDLSDADLNDARFSFSRLHGVRFSDAQLHRAYFVHSDLSNANGSRADLTEAHLDRATLKKINLRGAQLQRTKIRQANLEGADLSGADLSFTNLDRTSLRNANLHETNLSFATLRFTEFFNVDLSTTQGLDTVIHRGTSHLGIQTLSRSLERLPLTFLQGAGVPDSMLAYVRSLKQNTPIYATCLLSYAAPDRDFAQQLQTDLQAHGVLCESAPYDVEYEEVRRLLRAPMVIHDMLLLVVSAHSETEISRQALDGIVKEALLRERRGFTPILLPLHLGKAPQAIQGSWARLLRMAQHQSRDLTRWHDGDFYRAAFAQLLYDLKAEIVQREK
jgi:hypothetical protein